MRFLWYFATIAISLAFSSNVQAEDGAVTATVAKQPTEQVALGEVDSVTAVAEVPDEQVTLLETDSATNGDGATNRKARQFRTFGFFRPPPFYGGGFYRPPPFYGGGFYRPPPFYGGYYRPPPFYGGYYRPRPPPFYGGYGFYG